MTPPQRLRCNPVRSPQQRDKLEFTANASPFRGGIRSKRGRRGPPQSAALTAPLKGSLWRKRQRLLDIRPVFVTYCLRTLAAKFQFITCRPVRLPVCSQNGSVALDDGSVGRITVQVSLQKARQTGKISNCGSAFSAHFPEYSFMHEKYTVNFQVCALRGYSCSRIVEIWCTLRYFPAESPKRKQFIQRESRFF